MKSTSNSSDVQYQCSVLIGIQAVEVLLKGAGVLGNGVVVDVLTLVCQASKVSNALGIPLRTRVVSRYTRLTLLRLKTMMSARVS
jgi:hypothetical protein